MRATPRASETLVLVCVVAMAGGCSGRLGFDPSLADAAPRGGPIGSNTGDGSVNWVGTGGTASNPAGNTGGQSAGTAGTAGTDAAGGTGGSASIASTGGAAGTGGNVVDGGSAAGQGGGAPPTAAACPSGFNVLDTVFTQKCGRCHGATSPTKNLDLVSAGLAARLVNKPSTCNNLPLIDGTPSGNAVAAGHLIDKLTGPVSGCGVQMPAGSTPLSATELACVNDWAVQAITKLTGGGYAP